jgi:hypothetical protein
VTIIDASAKPGGRLRWAGSTAASALVGSVDHLVAELAELGVKIEAGVVDEAAVRAVAPDHVIVATGTRPAPEQAFLGADGLARPASAQAASGPVLLDSAEALAAAADGAGGVGHAVIVYDTVGENEGALVAEALSARGARVTFVTPEEVAMPHGGKLHRVQLPETLWHRVERVITGGLIGAVDGRTVLVARLDGETLAEIEADAIVAVSPGTPNLDLVPVLRRLGIPYTIAGDAVSPRHAVQAFKDGHQAALAL